MRNLNFIGLTFVVLILASGVSGAENRMAVVKVVEPSGSTEAIPVVVETEVPTAGIQIVLGYNPAVLTIGKPRLTDRTSGMTLASHDHGGEVIILVYSLEGKAISAGHGPIVEFPFKASDLGLRSLDFGLQFEEVILAGTDCQAIPVQVVPITMKTVPLPTEFALEQNYPNPFNPSTTIHYNIPSREHRAKSRENGVGSSPFALRTTLKIYNVLGQEVRILVDEPKEAGYYEVTWDGRNEKGDEVSSGVYFYRLSADGTFTATKRMVLLK